MVGSGVWVTSMTRSGQPGGMTGWHESCEEEARGSTSLASSTSAVPEDAFGIQYRARSAKNIHWHIPRSGACTANSVHCLVLVRQCACRRSDSVDLVGLVKGQLPGSP